MKRFGLLVILLLVAFALVSCNPSQNAMWEKDKATGYGGLYRHIIIKNGITNEVVYEKSGRCFIDDQSNVNFLKVLWLDKNHKDNIYLGQNYSVVAEEIDH